LRKEWDVFRNANRFPKQAAAAVAVVALAAPATSAATPSAAQDHRSPDAVDAAIEAQQAQRNYEHLTRLEERRQAPGYLDHRSADAQDSGWVRSAEPLKIVGSPGFDWVDVSIGAGTILGLLMITLSAMFTVVHRRNRAATT
jgi:3-keto-L-gulonate-6-phosphate decarboxylase